MDFDWRQSRRNHFLSLILLILVAAVLIVGGYRWRQVRQTQRYTPDGTPIPVFTTQHTYDTLTYKYDHRTLSFSVNQESDQWQWTDDPDFPLDGSVVKEICSLVANLQPQQTLTPEETLEAYGFTDPVATLTAANDKETLSLTFGRATTDGESRYALMNGVETTVYILDDALLEKLAVAIYDMAQLPELPALTADTLDALTIKGAAFTVLASQRTEGEEGTTWRSGGGNVTDLPETKALLTELEQLAVDKCVLYRPSQEAVELCGFGEPVILTVSYRLNDREQSFVLRLGGPTLDGECHYVQLNEEDTIYQMADSRIATLLTLAESGLGG